MNNMFVATAGPTPTPSKLNIIEKNEQFSQSIDDNPQRVNNPKTIKTDNTYTNAENEPVDKPPQDFNHTLRKIITAKTQPKADSNTVSKEQDAASGSFQEVNFGQPLSTSAEINLLTIDEKGQIVPNAVMPNILKVSLTADNQPGEGENTVNIQISNETVVTTKTADNGENTEGLTHTAFLVDNSNKETAIGEKTADKSATSNTQEIPSLNTDFPLIQDSTSKPQAQLVEIYLEKSVHTPTDNKVRGDQQYVEPISQNDAKSQSGQTSSELSDYNTKEQSGNLSGDSISEKLNITDVQISPGHTKDRGNSTYDSSSNSHFEQILYHNNSQTTITEQSPTSAEGSKTANLPEQTSSGDISSSIGKQILESIQSSLSQKSENQQITVRLNPPELGKVFIRFQEHDAQITGLLEVDKTQTRYEIEQALPQIIRDLADCGIAIRRLEVLLSGGEQSEQQAFRDHLLQNGWAQQQDSANSDAGSSNSPVNEWLTNENSFSGLHELRQMFAGDHSINILV